MSDNLALSDIMLFMEGMTGKSVPDAGNHAPNNTAPCLTAGELQYCAAKRGSARLRQRVEAVSGRFPVIALDVPADVKYVDIGVALGAAGTPIGSKDLLIAAHAIAMGIPLVTANIDQFTGICNLVVENWRE